MIKFYKDLPPTFQINHNQSNNYNSGDVAILIESGDLVLFPSNFQHDVPPTTSKETRISISFNTFIRGNLGDEDSSTALYLR
jgi:predicted 2-oxoglutarate/Fe(II)-dependent dioxygenase YbiX